MQFNQWAWRKFFCHCYVRAVQQLCGSSNEVFYTIPEGKRREQYLQRSGKLIYSVCSLSCCTKSRIIPIGINSIYHPWTYSPGLAQFYLYMDSLISPWPCAVFAHFWSVCLCQNEQVMFYDLSLIFIQTENYVLCINLMKFNIFLDIK